jgi:hypothetical protein
MIDHGQHQRLVSGEAPQRFAPYTAFNYDLHTAKKTTYFGGNGGLIDHSSCSLRASTGEQCLRR